jgi:hypothetical protein
VVLFSKSKHSCKAVIGSDYRQAGSMCHFDLLVDPVSWLGKALVVVITTVEELPGRNSFYTPRPETCLLMSRLDLSYVR